MNVTSRSSHFRAKLACQLLAGSRGFTLIELLVVIVIVGVLSAVGIPAFLTLVQRSRFVEGESAMANTASATAVYAFDCGSYNPVSYSNLRVTLSGCNGKGPWVEQAWTNLAPNYSEPTFVGNALGGQFTTGGDNGPYVGISCTKGLGASANGNDNCRR